MAEKFSIITIKLTRLCIAIVFCLFSFKAQLNAQNIGATIINQSDQTSSVEIVANTVAAAPECLKWRVSGVCFWLTCTVWECHIDTSMRVSHYIPSAVVSLYHDVDTHPWKDYGKTIAKSTKPVADAILGGFVDSSGTRYRDDGRDKNHMFRDGDAVGHPAGLIGSMLGSTDVYCPPDSSTYNIYYASNIDAVVWRDWIPVEMLYMEAWVPGLREVSIGGSLYNFWHTWGNVYPRNGNVLQQHPVKGAAVLAQRIGDVITRDNQVRIYQALKNTTMEMKDNKMVWWPPNLIEGRPDTGYWQMLAPRAKKSCEAFGSNDSVLPVSAGDGDTSGSGGYVFGLWRPISCCSKNGMMFIGYIGW